MRKSKKKLQLDQTKVRELQNPTDLQEVDGGRPIPSMCGCTREDGGQTAPIC